MMQPIWNRTPMSNFLSISLSNNVCLEIRWNSQRVVCHSGEDTLDHHPGTV